MAGPSSWTRLVSCLRKHRFLCCGCSRSENLSVRGAQPISVDVRVLAATNRNLKAAVASGIFRHDLF